MVLVQSEYELEKALVAQLAGTGDGKSGLGYELVALADEAAMLRNLKRQLEVFNELTTPLSEREFHLVLNHLSQGSTVFERAQILRSRYQLLRDNGDTHSLQFINQENWCQNEFQVTQQVSVHNPQQKTYKTRFDVTILINGLPLVQIELKRLGVDLKEAFNQIDRYHRDSYWVGHGLFLYTQIYVISNGADTKYFANNHQASFDFTFFWSDKDNNCYSDLHQFSDHFLRPCHVAKMITHYTVLNHGDKVLMLFRPYQFYAAEALIERAKLSNQHAYIWHTTGSGKTLTSFKVSQVIQTLPEVDLVMFVVDRKDLDYKTAIEFNHYTDGCVDTTNDTSSLIKQIKASQAQGGKKKLIVTTLQKLNIAVTTPKYLNEISYLQDKKVVFIFDECHRSQFGQTHQNIKKFFTKVQMFGFTGTPILEENVSRANGIPQTTKDLFNECLHKYVITDAIRDNNVLRFSVEYVGKYQEKAQDRVSNNELDIVSDLEPEAEDSPGTIQATASKETLEDERRLEKIVRYIVEQHPKKTNHYQFNAIFCVSSVQALIKYYQLFEQVQAEALASNPNYRKLKVATIFSYAANEAESKIEQPDMGDDGEQAQVSRDHLERFIVQYNQQYGSQFSLKDTASFYNYYQDITKRVEKHAKQPQEAQIDILLVVNMFLTGFDAKTLNTLYVDKNLKYHGLIQAFSRTNRIYNASKTHGNIVCFRNLKEKTDEAITLFANTKANESVLLQPYSEYLAKYHQAVDILLGITPTVDSVDSLADENEQAEFVKAFRDLLRLQATLKSFSDFNPDDLSMDADTFGHFESKYLRLHDDVKNHKKIVAGTQTNQPSVLDELDFETELIHTDIINVAYILNLLKGVVDEDHSDWISGQENFMRRVQAILDIAAKEPKLRVKLPLLEKFVQEVLPSIQSSEAFDMAFADFWEQEKQQAIHDLVEEEQLKDDCFQAMVESFVFTNTLPRDDEIAQSLSFVPKILERESTLSRIKARFERFVGQFVEGAV